MGFALSTQRSAFFKECTVEEQKKFFSLSEKKFIPHVDTFYYSIFIKNDVACSKDEREKVPSGVLLMINFFEFAKSQFLTKENIHERDLWYDYEKDLLLSKRKFSIYDFCIRKEGYYDIFISSYLPNDNTPRIVVQLRSIGLWTLGEYQLIQESFAVVSELLFEYGLSVDRTQENRIDFCYHTNILQNPEKVYSDNSLANNLHTSFTIYNKVGRKRGRKLTVEYLSLGQRSSNNLFFRSYNKVREVIEENYKEFFLEFWYNSKLINYYDFYVYSYAFQKKSYSQIYWGMLNFYLEYGKNNKILDDFEYIKQHSMDYSTDELKEIVLSVCPKPTLIINIEFQCMRKFFYSFNKALETVLLPIDNECKFIEIFRLFQILDNRKLFLDYLTSNAVSFQKDLEEKELKQMLKENSESIYLDFWKRLRSTKISINCNVTIYRDYSRKLNRDLLVSRIKSSLASLSLYDNHWESDINGDMSNLISILNDNDVVQNADGTYSVIDDDYIRMKENKKKALKSLLNKPKRPSQND
ncbi:hypothetical protein FDB44_17300 [Clostridium botulinum]|uniref:Uncharacterized protein n=2 Tax=Clostridium TaxID=1485 RepID=A0A9Q4TR82_CLOBO|nr:hypothetical protein [Clostridium botulinum]MBY6935731.1 hypothetical protein [Clostridium botulinum]NFL84688.1 hypothetical protein [Clostridium botulinum]NFN13297.1 hypothetical protein [Clostridium botulinum]NFO38463.1 hypothetical protein [Clostridium botulinum]NFO45272.1 hypothetical protein [Clostridium botulinum]